MRYILIYLFVFIFSCDNKETILINKLPRPGQERRFQIYYLQGLNDSDFLKIPNELSLENDMDARFIKKSVDDEREIERLLREWAARSFDLLVIGSKNAQRIWDRLALSYTPRGKVVFLGQRCKDSQSGLGIVVPDKVFFDLRNIFCSEKIQSKLYGCIDNFPLTNSIQSTLSVPPLVLFFKEAPLNEINSIPTLTLKIKWVDLFENILKGNASKNYDIDMSSALMEIDESLDYKKFEKKYPDIAQDFIRWKLGELSKKGSNLSP